MSELSFTTAPTDPHTELVRGMYRGFLGREPDAPGLAHWVARLGAGTASSELVEAIMASPEYLKIQAGRARHAALRQAMAAAGVPLLGQPLSIVDIGAQELEGEQHVYAPLQAAGLPCRVTGFEPQEDKIAASLARQPDGSLRLYPTFIGDGGTHTFHINNDDATSSLLPLNRPLTGELVDLSHLETVRTFEVATSRLDDVLKDDGTVDFLKLDIQGFELPALEHAREVLARTNVVHCEVSFMPIYAGQALFSDIEALLRAAGFTFMDFSSLCRYPYHGAAQGASRDRLGWGDAVFFRTGGTLAPRDLLAQALVALLVYDKPSYAEHLARRHDVATGAALAAPFDAPAPGAAQ
ncbi:FkbM family methyltransferase [Massilia sp. METH4]|uniref:FkbM family methyltransferase n=1 Tax=Massilia sp. METH4 TaxID=3123041 RepID=UPI0030D382CD